MRRPANSVRLACGHPMCDPGSAECRTRDQLAATPGEAEQLRTNALAALGQTRPTFPIERDLEPRAISEWMRAAPPGVTRERVAETWRRSRPGFARLLDLTDHD